MDFCSLFDFTPKRGDMEGWGRRWRRTELLMAVDAQRKQHEKERSACFEHERRRDERAARIAGYARSIQITVEGRPCTCLRLGA